MKESKQRPPQLANRFFKWVCGNASVEDYLGDLEELYKIQSTQKGSIIARWNYWKQVISLAISYALRRRKADATYPDHYSPNRWTMIKNYFKISFRNLKKQKVFTVLNTLGLSMGMSIALLALAMGVELHQFDKFHQHSSSIYRVTTNLEEAGDRTHYASSPPALTYQMDQQIIGIINSVHINDYFFPTIKHKGQVIHSSGYFTESSFFQLFDFELTEGSYQSLDEPGTTIITKELSWKLFGDQSAMGKIIETEEWGQLRVTGVLAPFPKNTHLSFELLTGFPTSNQFTALQQTSNWVDFKSNYYYFIADTDVDKIKSQLTELGEQGYEHFQEENQKATYELQHLLDITPGPLMSDNLGVVFETPILYLFFGVGLLILIPACFNYTNMSIARALKRSKEIGIRKVMGSQRRQVIEQFLIETVMVSLIAVVLSAYIFYLIRNEYLGMLVGASSLSLSLTLPMILTFFIFAILTGLFTGIIPAFYFAKVSPIQALKDGMSNQKVKISTIRKGLLVAQFTITLVFMIGIGVLLRQYQYSLTYNLGFQKENTLVVPVYNGEIELLRNSFSSQSDVTDVSFSSAIPGVPLTQPLYIYYPQLQDSLRTKQVFIDPAFIGHMDLDLVWGASITESQYQVEQVLVNETFMRRQKLIHEHVEDSLQILLANSSKAQIIGIVKDYNHEPLNERIEPMILRKGGQELSFMLLTISSQNLSATISNLEATWDKVHPNEPFNATFLEYEIEAAYDFFRNGIKIFGFLAAMAVTISCLGLLGMVIYTTENRTKEVAIRKILGATRTNLMQTLAGLFIKLWLIAIVIAVPVSYLFYDNFMVRLYNKFSDGVGPIEIAASVLITLVLGALAIFWQTNKIIQINPAANLRND